MMDQELKQYLDAKFATKQDFERVETALLTEFHKWASPADMRARTQRRRSEPSTWKWNR
jgi:hypothetical protein